MSERRCGFVLTGHDLRIELVGNTVKMQKADRASLDKVPSSKSEGEISRMQEDHRALQAKVVRQENRS